MYPRSLGLWASLALAANCVLIPSTFEGVETPASANVYVPPVGATNKNTVRHAVEVPCPGCPFAVRNGDGAPHWTKDVANSLLVTVETRDDGQADSLLINGVQVYPPSFEQLDQFMVVYQMEAGVDVSKNGVPPSVFENVLLITGYEFHVESARTMAEDGLELLPMTIRLTALENKAINIPALTINMLKDSAGRLYVASMEESLPTPPSSPFADNSDCSDWPLFCTVRNAMAEKLELFKAKLGKHCHGFRPHHAGRPHHKPHHSEPRPGDVPQEMAGEGHRHHRHHHHGMHRNRVGHFLHAVVVTAVIPIIFGMLIGVCMYAVGFLLGSIIAFVLGKMRGSDRSGYVALDTDEEVSAKEAEATELSAEDLEAPPVYQEAAEKEVVH